MKRYPVWKRTLRYVGLMLASVLVLLAIGFATPRQWWISPQTSCDITIQVTSNGFHTNLIVPVQTAEFDWRSRLSLADIGDGSITGYRYLGFGWGDRDFYMNTPTLADLNLSTIVRAMVLSAGSVLHIQGYATMLQTGGGLTVKTLRLSSANYLALMQFIERSFQHDRQGHLLVLKRGYRHNSSFYAAIGKYSLIRTCNAWTGDGLRAANINTPLWTGLAPAIMLHLRNGCAIEPTAAHNS